MDTLKDKLDKNESIRRIVGLNVPTAVSLIKEQDQTVSTILRMYGERIEPLDPHREQRLMEYCGYIKQSREKAGKNDWFSWMHKGIMTVANKSTVDQRNIAYLIGIYKRWLKSGFGAFYSEEEDKLRDFFCTTFGFELSPAANTVFNELLQDYGITYATIAIACSTPNTEDPSLRCIKQCKSYLVANCKRLNERTERTNGEDRAISGDAS